MTKTAHSEFGQLIKVLVSPPKNAFVSARKLEAEWRSLNFLACPDLATAESEYAGFAASLTGYGAEVAELAGGNGLSIDAIYCRDASIATDYGMIICRMGKEARAAEPGAQRAFFLAQGMAILGEIAAPGTLEGGDVAWLDEKTVAVGHTYRTNAEGIRQLTAMLEPRDVEVLVADLPHYRGPADVFHLMSILSPVDKDLAVVYSPLMPIAFRNELLRRGYKFIEVSEEEFDSMGCNVLAVAPRKCLMVSGNPVTEARLTAAGCDVTTYRGEEISLKGGGGPTCLTRPLLRLSGS